MKTDAQKEALKTHAAELLKPEFLQEVLKVLTERLANQSPPVQIAPRKNSGDAFGASWKVHELCSHPKERWAWHVADYWVRFLEENFPAAASMCVSLGTAPIPNAYPGSVWSAEIHEFPTGELEFITRARWLKIQ